MTIKTVLFYGHSLRHTSKIPLFIGVENRFMGGSRGGGQGIQTPLRISQVAIGLLRNTGTDSPLEGGSHKYNVI